MTTKIAVCLLALLIAGTGCRRAPESSADWAAVFYTRYRLTANVTYEMTPQGAQKLDVYRRIDAPGPRPTVFFIHGGAWEHGSKDDVLGNTLPWLEMGWTVVNVNYRLAKEAPAPAAVEDCLCALHWVAANADKYQFDLNRLVISGASAGGELALVVGMAPPGAGLDRDPKGPPLPRPAAIVSFSGVVDVADLLSGPHAQGFAGAWIGKQPDPGAVARRVSPVSYVRPGLPPILSVHGDSDATVPYGETVRFHEALTRAGVHNRLLTIKGGGHGGYSPEQYLLISRTLREFLARNRLEIP
jgi:acetyl esterase/lipase